MTPSRRTTLALETFLAASLAACTTTDLNRLISAADEAEALIQRVNLGIERVDTAAKSFCPQIQLLNVSASAVACAARASGTSQTRLARFAEYGRLFCANPSAGSLASLALYIADGLRAARAATAASCPSQ